MCDQLGSHPAELTPGVATVTATIGTNATATPAARRRTNLVIAEPSQKDPSPTLVASAYSLDNTVIWTLPSRDDRSLVNQRYSRYLRSAFSSVYAVGAERKSQFYQFQNSSGNVSCNLGSGGAACEISDRAYTISTPPPPCAQHCAWGAVSPRTRVGRSSWTVITTRCTCRASRSSRTARHCPPGPQLHQRKRGDEVHRLEHRPFLLRFTGLLPNRATGPAPISGLWSRGCTTKFGCADDAAGLPWPNVRQPHPCLVRV